MQWYAGLSHALMSMTLSSEAIHLELIKLHTPIPVAWTRKDTDSSKDCRHLMTSEDILP